MRYDITEDIAYVEDAAQPSKESQICIDGDGDIAIMNSDGHAVYVAPAELVDALKALKVLPWDADHRREMTPEAARERDDCLCDGDGTPGSPLYGEHSRSDHARDEIRRPRGDSTAGYGRAAGIVAAVLLLALIVNPIPVWIVS